MNINNLIEFIYLAETLSFRRTADYFYVSRSVISRHLASLEDVLGVKLLDRGNQSVQLTEAGKVFYHEAQTVLRAYATAIDRTRAAGQTSGRAVRIGYLKNAARPVLVRFLRYMGHEHPEIHVDTTYMEYSKLIRAMEEDSIDIALSMSVDPAIARKYRSTHIYDDRFYAVMSKDHPLASRTELSLAELRDEKLLLPDNFVFAGLGELAEALVKEKAQEGARDFYRDVDMLYLKLQTEGFVAFSSGLNNAMFGNRLAVVPVTDIDSSFRFCAFYNDSLSSDAFDACRKGFESCRAAMQSWDSSQEVDAVGFSVAAVD